MVMSGFVLLALLVSLGTSVVVGAAVVTYVIRTWQQIRAGDDGHRDDRVLDGIDRIERQLSALSERLTRLGRAALPAPGDAPGEAEAGPEPGPGPRLPGGP